ERTLALLIEKYAGAFPTWMAPVQVKILPIGEGHREYCRELNNRLINMGIRSECDDRSEKIGYKIREAQLEKVPYMLVVGDKEVEDGAVAVRSRKEGDRGSMKVNDFILALMDEIANKTR
ncbi:MAG: threonine--tRNA ligase, partial [Clostridia bacterium]|nr:threonine--tRNA ligase [Clostridia bacterium]